MKRTRKSVEAEKGPKAKSPKLDEVCYFDCFDKLEDQLVLKIFKKLDLEDVVFLVPQVCKKWYQLSSSELLWKEAQLFYCYYSSDHDKKLFFKGMKMAPCLSFLTLELNYIDGIGLVKLLKKNSPNMIKGINFIYDNMPPKVMFTLLTKYKDSLEQLTITDTYTPYTEDDVKLLWRTIQNLTNLKELTIDGSALLYHKAYLRRPGPCWQTLRVLNVKDSGYENMNTVQRLIAVNPNWTEVYLSMPESSLYRPEIKALSHCPNLTCVQVPFCKEVSLLGQCGMLDSIIIDCESENVEEVKDVVSTFSKRTVFCNLKSVKVLNASSAHTNVFVTLIKGRKVSMLNFVSCDFTDDDLKEILKSAPKLENLYFFEISGDSLVAVLSKVGNDGLAPKLKALNVNECYCDEEKGTCVKRAVSHLQEQRPDLKTYGVYTKCKCEPVESLGKNNGEKEVENQIKNVKENEQMEEMNMEEAIFHEDLEASDDGQKN